MAIHRPRFLHIATHGFFYLLEDSSALAKELSSGVDRKLLTFRADPLNASGIALAGIVQTQAAWAAGRPCDFNDDGVLTAQQAHRLDLTGTDLAVLAACKTGLTHAVSGAGAIGLRAAFYEAGAENVVTTLWDVDDKYSVQFMNAFYQRYLRGESAEKAFAETQREAFTELLSEKNKPTTSLREVVRKAGPFAISVAGSLAPPVTPGGP